MSYEMSEERRQLVELLEDLTSRLRNGCSRFEAASILEEAINEAEKMEAIRGS